jgi:hypothetical protein
MEQQHFGRTQPTCPKVGPTAPPARPRARARCAGSGLAQGWHTPTPADESAKTTTGDRWGPLCRHALLM